MKPRAGKSPALPLTNPVALPPKTERIRFVVVRTGIAIPVPEDYEGALTIRQTVRATGMSGQELLEIWETTYGRFAQAIAASENVAAEEMLGRLERAVDQVREGLAVVEKWVARQAEKADGARAEVTRAA